MRTSLALPLLLLGCNPSEGDSPPGGTDPATTAPHGTDVLQFKGPVPQNLLFLSVDTLRRDHVGAYGDLGLTPFLDGIAAEGVVLEDHMQCSNWTFGSTTCTLAGRYNIERGHLPRLNGTEETRPPVPDGTPFLATWLGQNGFYNILVSGNAWLGEGWGNAQGYHDVLEPGGAAIAGYETGLSALEFATMSGLAKRWFMHLHFMEPHAAYAPPDENVEGIEDLEPWPDDLTDRDYHYAARDLYGTYTPEEQELLEDHLRLLYAGEVRTIDQRFEIIWNDMESRGLLDDTLVVIWNDHGEQFWEHGNQTHAYTLHNEENDGIALFWAKNLVPGRYDGPTAAIDIVPTLLDLYEIPMPPEVTGHPIGSAPADRPRFAEALARSGGVQSVALDGYKLHYRWSGAMTFYDRNVDPLETEDLYDPTDPRVITLWAHLKPMVDAMAPLVVGGDPAPNYPDDLP